MKKYFILFIFYSFSINAALLDNVYLQGHFTGKMDSKYAYIKDQYNQKIGLERKYLEKIYFLKHGKRKKIFDRGYIEISIPKKKIKFLKKF